MRCVRSGVPRRQVQAEPCSTDSTSLQRHRSNGERVEDTGLCVWRRVRGPSRWTEDLIEATTEIDGFSFRLVVESGGSLVGQDKVHSSRRSPPAPRCRNAPAPGTTASGSVERSYLRKNSMRAPSSSQTPSPSGHVEVTSSNWAIQLRSDLHSTSLQPGCERDSRMSPVKELFTPTRWARCWLLATARDRPARQRAFLMSSPRPTASTTGEPREVGRAERGRPSLGRVPQAFASETETQWSRPRTVGGAVARPCARWRRTLGARGGGQSFQR